QRPAPGSRWRRATAAAVPPAANSSAMTTGRKKRAYFFGVGSQPMKNSSRSGAWGSLGACADWLMSKFLNRGGLYRRPRWQRSGVQEHAPVLDADAEGGDALLERRRRLTVPGPVLPAVPGAGDAPIDELAFAQRPALVG